MLRQKEYTELVKANIEYEVCDDVELMKAYKENLISEEEYKKAKVICKKIIAFLNKNHQEFLDYMVQLREELNYELLNNND